MAQNHPPEASLDVIAAQGSRLIRQLRQQTDSVFFEFLHDGVQAQNDAVLTDEQIFTKELKQRLLGLMETFEHLEKVTAMLPKQPLPNLGGNLSYMMQNTLGESSNNESLTSYDNSLNMYGWLHKVHESSQYCHAFVGHYIRRNQSKLHRRLTTPAAVNNQILKQLTQTLQKSFPQLQLTMKQRGNNTYLLFANVCSVGHQAPATPVIKIALLIRGQPFIIEWANVKGPDEDFADENGRLDLHSQSRHLVFRKLTNQVKGAALNCMVTHNTPPAGAINQYMQSAKVFFCWLAMYRNLFSEPCFTCKRILRDYLPPYCRDYRKLEQQYHECCK